jgi:hypothetical protein
MSKAKTPLFTLPIDKPERRALKLAAAKAETSMAALVRRGIGVVLSELSPEDAETWEAMQTKRTAKKELLTV